MTTATTYPLNEFEWRGHSIMAEAGQMIGAVSKRGKLALWHVSTIRGFHNIAARYDELNRLFHDAEQIAALESASEERLRPIIETMSQLVPTSTRLIAQVRGLKLGYWRRAYEPVLGKLEQRAAEFDAHFRALADAHSGLLLLTRNDLTHLAATIENPPEPNEALRRVMTRH